ncbi:ABC transporter permease [Fodinicola feengrottensis]|uniref:ABC transporter permease n=1 Tax=Fodinicola feengrottensis TaxID=435914 RepID=A0ABP4U4Z3_9ACTN
MRFVARRLALYVVIAWAAITINFLIPRMMPGDPVDLLVDRLKGQVDPAAITSLRQAFGLSDASLLNQYWDYLGNLFHGDLGRSISFYPTAVSDVIATTLPWTLGLIGVCTVISFVLGTSAGIIAAWKRGGWTDMLVPSTTFLHSIPYFWMALLLVFIFGVVLGWLPISGAYDTDLPPVLSGEFIGSVLYHALLPAITIVVSSIAGWLLGMRNMMITTLGEDYVTLAQAKGLSRMRVMTAYAARNAILPSFTGFALSLGFVVGGSMLTEVIFSYPGVGYTLYQAVQNEDFPLMQGLFLVISLSVLAANLLADLAYVLLDPRIRANASGAS